MKTTIVWVRENLIAPLLIFICAGVWGNFVQNGKEIRKNTEDLKITVLNSRCQTQKSDKNDIDHELLINRIITAKEKLTSYYLDHSVKISNLDANQKSIIREIAEIKSEIKDAKRE
ncbi:hypothetical protein OAA08_00985 [bacterium]|jgi:hypothetical protein|nr:hypothetical protein [bacterium]